VKKPKSQGHLTEQGRWAIVFHHLEGKTPDQIAVMLNVQPETVKKWVSVYEATSGVVTSKKQRGPKTKWDARTVQSIKRALVKYSLVSASEVREKTPVATKNLSDRTLSRIMTGPMGTKVKSKRRAQALTSLQKTKRVAFATAHLDDDVTNIVWTDESMFRALGTPHKRRCVPGQDPGTTEEVSHPPQVMVWGAISLSGVCYLHVLSQYVTAETYCKTVTTFLKDLPSGLSRATIIFMQDNASPHTAKVTKAFLKSKGVSVLEGWPAHSPDLNPIENIWSWLKAEVRKKGSRNADDLAADILVAWGKIPPHVIANTIKSIPKRLADVILSGGEKVH